MAEAGVSTVGTGPSRDRGWRRVARRLRAAAFEQPAPPARPRTIYGSYAEALAGCGGYEEADLLDVIAAKTRIVRDEAAALEPAASNGDLHSLLALMASELETRHSPLKVLDFGGACGAHYYKLRRLAPRQQLHWVIVETPGMAARANGLVPGGASLSAVASIAEAVDALGTVDLVHASGTLQCTPNPCAALAEMLAIRAPVLLLTRGAVTTSGREIIVVHESSLASNGPGPLPPGFQDRSVSYPFVFASRDRLLAQLHAVYRRILMLPDHSGHVPVNQEPVSGFAALCSEPW
jgi:putative methyltransferase (TIGR04325 family)